MIFKRNQDPTFFEKKKATGSVKHNSKSALAQLFGNANTTGGSPIGGGGNYQTARFNPVWDRLEEGSIIEDWIPRDAAGLDKMFRILHARDISGAVIDIISNIIWSDFELVGVKDKKRLKVYLDTMDNLKAQDSLPDITREFMVIGKQINSLIFNSTRGTFVDWIPQDPDFCRLTPVPLKGVDPKIDLIPSPAMREFLYSQDPRDLDARKKIPKEYLNAIASAGSKGVPLSPLTTLYLCRKISPYDHIGTSALSRVIPFWALEKALLNSTMSAARRRTRAILHITAGLDNIWEPTSEELESIASMFIQADEDPNGSVIVTRTGVTANEVRDGANFWKYSDEYEFVTTGKLRALGVNESILSGDSTYNNQESAKSLFVENLLALRNTLTQRIFYDKLFALLARANGFVKEKQIQIDEKNKDRREELEDNLDKQGVKTSVAKKIALSQYGDSDDAMSIPIESLDIPTIQWKKVLKAKVDDKELEILSVLEEKGFPVTLKDWATATGKDLNAQIDELQADSKLRQNVSQWKASYSKEAEAMMFFDPNNKYTKTDASLKDTKDLTVGELHYLPVWDSKGDFLNLSYKEATAFLNKVVEKGAIIYDPEAYKNFTLSYFQGNEMKSEIANYLVGRIGLAQTAVSKKALAEIVNHMGKLYKEAPYREKDLGRTASHLRAMTKEYTHIKQTLGAESIQSAVAHLKPDNIPNGSAQIYSGV